MSTQHEFLDPKVLSRLSGLPIYARQPMLGNVSGRHRSPIKGSSIEFAQYRKYVPGDDTRRLDWRAWGRSDRFYIKEFEADTNLRMCLIVDTSGSMNYGTKGNTKLDYARHMAGTLAFLAARQGDAVGLYCASEEFTREIPPKRSAIHLRTVLDELGSLEPEGETGLVTALHQAAEKIQQRAMIVILSDLFVEPAELKDAIQHLKFRKHDVAIFHLLERHEIDFDFERPTRFVDLEGGSPMLVDPDIIGPQYRKALAEYLEAVTTIVNDAAVDYHRISVEESYETVIARFLLGRTPKQAK